MDVRVAGHQVDTGEALREHAIGRMEEITEKYFSRAVAANVTFGRGPHMCVGAPLARLELTVALEELLAAAPGFALDGEPRQTRFPEIGALSVPVRFEDAA